MLSCMPILFAGVASGSCDRPGTRSSARPGGGVADNTVIGQTGEVLVRIRGGDLPGEILTTVRGVRETFVAYADAPLDRGARVLVIAARGPRQVDVVGWPE